MKILKRSVLLLSIILICFGMLFIFIFIYKKINPPKPLNLIIISIDTLRPDHMGIYGYNKNTTPNIDEWAAKSAVFTNAYTAVPYTYSSFSSLLTGLHPFNTGSYKTVEQQQPLNSSWPILAKILKERNYNTAVFMGSEFLTPKRSNFDYSVDQYSNLAYWKSTDYNFDKIIKDSTAWINVNKKNKFFLWVHFMDPHAPYEPPKDYRCKFDAVVCDDISTDEQIKNFEKERLRFKTCPSEAASNKMISTAETLYDGEIFTSDLLFKKIIDNIYAQGLEKNSIIVLYGDHGEGFDHNYNFGHGGVLYNSSVKIPLIIYVPINLSHENKVNTLVDNTDIFVSLLDLLGLKPDIAKTDGFSFKDSLIKDNVFSKLTEFGFFKPASPQRKYVYMSTIGQTKIAITDGKYKYIRSLNSDCLNGNKYEELYNVLSDPPEKNNLIDSDKNTANVLYSALQEFLEKSDYTRSTGTGSLTNPTDTNLINKMKSFGY